MVHLTNPPELDIQWDKEDWILIHRVFIYSWKNRRQETELEWAWHHFCLKPCHPNSTQWARNPKSTACTMTTSTTRHLCRAHSRPCHLPVTWWTMPPHPPTLICGSVALGWMLRPTSGEGRSPMACRDPILVQEEWGVQKGLSAGFLCLLKKTWWNLLDHHILIQLWLPWQ